MSIFVNLPSEVLTAIQMLNNAGYEAYAVGGCVRDSILGREPDDWDVTTSATPEETQRIFADFPTIETGIKHGTLTAIVEGMPLEITTYRIDGCYSDGRHPDDISFTGSLSEDLRRRDFTINAMAYHPKNGLVDLYEGQKDLSAGVIRCVGDPYQRFEEDALRILRALRFSSVLGFAIEADTERALCSLSSNLSKVSAERLIGELSKLLCGEKAEAVVRRYRRVITEFLPEIGHDTDLHGLSVVRPTITARLAALFYGAAISPAVAKIILQRLRLDNKTAHNVSLLMTNITRCLYTEDTYLLHVLQLVGPDLVFDYLTLRGFDGDTVSRVRQILDTGECYCLSMLAVNGEDVIAAGIEPGRRVGETLQMLLDAVIDGVCPNDKKTLLEYVKLIKKPVQ